MAAAFSVLVLTAQAQEDGGEDGSEAESDTGGTYEFGGGVWKPVLHVYESYTDNFYYQPDTEESAYGTLVNPELHYRTEAGRFTLDSTAQAEYGTFDTPGSGDDFLDADLRARFDLIATVRNRFELSGRLTHDHDPFGVDRTEDPTARNDALDRWNRATGGLRYRFGAPGTAVNAELGASVSRKHYITNRSETQTLDFETVTRDYALYYNLSPKSAALIDLRRTDYDFESPMPGGAENRNGATQRILAGARWKASAKTSGDVRVGLRRRTFDNGAPTLEALDWQAGVRWNPRSRTVLELRTARSERDSYLAGVNTIDLKSAGLTWTQSLTPRLRSEVNFEHVRASFIGSDRRDDIRSATVGFGYLIGRLVMLTPRVGYADRDSTFANRDYDRLNGYIGVRIGR